MIKNIIWSAGFWTLLILPLAIFGQDQKTVSDRKFSDPTAPVGNKSLTVPDIIRPILDVWMRDTYVMYGPDGNYYLTGTTASPNRIFPNGTPHCWDYNDGIYLWKSKDLKSWQKLGLIWSFDKNAADWQKKGKPVLAGAKSVNNDALDSLYRAVWAPEIHYIKGQKRWLIVACLNGGQGSFILESTSGKPEGPYRNIAGNADKPIFKNIDASLFEDDNGDVYVVGHNHFIAKMKPDLSDLAEPFRQFAETPYNPEPYIEGVFLTKHDGKYQLLQTVWSVPKKDGTYTYLKDNENPKLVYSYDVVVAESANINGPYGERYPAILEGGHNNLFKDKKGELWSSTFFNPRGLRGAKYSPTCRPAIVPVKWKNGKLLPDAVRAEQFYSK
ncbi:family 43 glycosylhydrolase [Dyadobacter subterraneus]|uniref:Family 43 glycosylhydrolase n=1 Tax=Dyadobacter subterraneus TaxID=2773304 RepID=A0ABR9WEV7_9BACT|nr:family 43 glycosylhydrolase [Dyadobacter subterraneus]MBE9463960.1 family 43 glycosylhydrolase [Dyadobacter subterraneus]